MAGDGSLIRMACGYDYAGPDGDSRACPRPALDGRDRCPFHLATGAGAEVDTGDTRNGGDGATTAPSSADLRAAVCADLRSDDERRLEYVGATLDSLDLSSLAIETDGIETITFRDLTVTGTLDLSGSVVEHPVVFDNCTVGRLDAMDATFESHITVADSRLGTDGQGTALTFRRATVAGRCRLDDTLVDGSAEFAGCTVESYFDVDGVSVAGDAHFPSSAFERAQVIDTTFERSVQFTGTRSSHATFERVRFAHPPRFDEAVFGTLRFRPAATVECRLVDATVEAGRLDQPDEGRALYDMTDATLGDVAIDCSADTLDRYRFYRTRYDGFPFAEYRTFLRENRWRLHEYAGEPETSADVDGIERTYLEAKQGATAVGDNENAAAFFVREMRYRRRRYADHLRDGSRTLTHRFDAALRWATNAFLDLIAGYGERPQRTVTASLAVIVLSALAYPALGGLRMPDSSDPVVTYASSGVSAFADSLYFSVVTFTTLGYGDFLPVTDLGRLVAGAEALSGAFLVALFVFSLGRRVTR